MNTPTTESVALLQSAVLADFTIQSELGRNSGGVVFKAFFKKDKNIYVLKRKLIGESISHKDVQNEVKLLEQLKHKNVVKCYGSFWDEDTRALHIILEYCDGGDLRGLINRHKGIGIHLDESFIWRIFDQICAGLLHLHEHGIVHRDMKSMNILLADNGSTAKITDLGVSRQVSENTFLLKTLYGTPLYLSPEIVSGQEYNEKTDIWSLGIILYEMSALTTPFHGKSLLALATAINEGKLDPIPSVYSQGLKDFIVWMLTMDFNSRPSVVDVIRRRNQMLKQSDSDAEVSKRAHRRPPLGRPRRPPVAQQREVISKEGPAIPLTSPDDDESVADTLSGDNRSDSEDSLEEGVKSARKETQRPAVKVRIEPVPAKAVSSSEPHVTHAILTKKRSDDQKFTSSTSNNCASDLDKANKIHVNVPIRESKNSRGNSANKNKSSETKPREGKEVSGDESEVPVNKDRLHACIRRHTLLLRRALKLRAFSSGEPNDSPTRGHNKESLKLEEEIRRLTELLAQLDKAASSGMIAVSLGVKLNVYIPSDSKKGSQNESCSHNRTSDDNEEEFHYIPGSSMHISSAQNVGVKNKLEDQGKHMFCTEYHLYFFIGIELQM